MRGFHWRLYDGGNYDALDRGDFDSVHRKQIAKQYAVFVNRLQLVGRHPPMGNELAIAARAMRVRLRREDAEHGIGVPDIEYQ